MSKNYENKSIHNKDFLDSLINDYPEQYFDWKVTVQFYVNLHKLYCVLLSNGLDIETSHMQNIKNLKSISTNLSRDLFTLYKNSRQARYDGFINEDAMLRINKINFNTGVSISLQINSESEKYHSYSV